MRLIVGLGNPGVRYAVTRHNVGASVLLKAAERWSFRWRPSGDARWGRGRVGDVEVLLAIDLAWMNQSGPAVKALLEQAGSSGEDLVVVHDDLDLPLGRIRIKQHGGAGGHRGVLSILTSIESDAFCRLKVGIGSSPPEQDPADYVLSSFFPDELQVLDATLERCVSALESLLTEGVEAAMNRFNVKEQAMGDGP